MLRMYPSTALFEPSFWEQWRRIEWMLLVVNIIFSSTFLTLLGIVLILNKDFRRVVLLSLAWILWLTLPTLFLFVRLLVGIYYFGHIIVDLICFCGVKLLYKAYCALMYSAASIRGDVTVQERLSADLEAATSFEQWLKVAKRLDEVTGAAEWRRVTGDSDVCEWGALKKQVERLSSARSRKALPELMFLLRLCCSRCYCGISAPELHTHALSGTKHIIEDFSAEVCKGIEAVCEEALAAIDSLPAAALAQSRQNGAAAAAARAAAQQLTTFLAHPPLPGENAVPIGGVVDVGTSLLQRTFSYGYPDSALPPTTFAETDSPGGRLHHPMPHHGCVSNVDLFPLFTAFPLPVNAAAAVGQPNGDLCCVSPYRVKRQRPLSPPTCTLLREASYDGLKTDEDAVERLTLGLIVRDVGIQASRDDSTDASNPIKRSSSKPGTVSGKLDEEKDTDLEYSQTAGKKERGKGYPLPPKREIVDAERKSSASSIGSDKKQHHLRKILLLPASSSSLAQMSASTVAVPGDEEAEHASLNDDEEVRGHSEHSGDLSHDSKEIEATMGENRFDKEHADNAEADTFGERQSSTNLRRHLMGLNSQLGEYNNDLLCSSMLGRSHSIDLAVFGNLPSSNKSLSEKYERLKRSEQQYLVGDTADVGELGHSGTTTANKSVDSESFVGPVPSTVSTTPMLSSECLLNIQQQNVAKPAAAAALDEDEGSLSELDPDVPDSFAKLSSLIQEISRFLVTLRLSYGRTALCLSGGGSLAMYHMGVVRTLLELDSLPRVISGTSGGSIVAGVAAIHTDEELLRDMLRPDVVHRYGCSWFPPVSKQLKRFLFCGQMMDGVQFQETCKAYFGQYTFREAFQRTGRLVSIVVTPAGSSRSREAVILNHINSPDVFIWSAVCASCALPGLLPPHELIVRGVDGSPAPYCPAGLIKWIDGSLQQDIPMRELACLFNVKQFIVSQVNPHHAPFVQAAPAAAGPPRALQALERWLTLDIKNRYGKLAKFNMVPKIFGHNVASFWMVQVYEGNVTITPQASLLDWYRMVSQPSEEDMHDYLSRGAQRTWPHCPRVMQALKIEHTLRKCWGTLATRMQRTQQELRCCVATPASAKSLEHPEQKMTASCRPKLSSSASRFPAVLSSQTQCKGNASPRSTEWVEKELEGTWSSPCSSPIVDCFVASDSELIASRLHPSASQRHPKHSNPRHRIGW